MFTDTKNQGEFGNCPCYQCPKRKPSCHDSCEDYKNWKLDLDYTKKQIRKQQAIEWEARPCRTRMRKR